MKVTVIDPRNGNELVLESHDHGGIRESWDNIPDGYMLKNGELLPTITEENGMAFILTAISGIGYFAAAWLLCF